MKHLGSAPSNESPICKIHLIEAKQHHGTPGFVPKWTGQHGPSTTPGHYTQSVKLIKPVFVSIENSKATLGIQESTTRDIKTCTVLGIVYSNSPRTGTRFCHHSPSAHTVSEHLKNTVGSATSIHPNDSICSTCYKVHSSILKALRVYRIKTARTRLHITSCGCRKKSSQCGPAWM